jgi:hypothetical protein
MCKLSSVTSIADLRARLSKPLLLELKTGCLDTAVVGGIEKLVKTVGKPFADVQAVVSGYGDLNIAERQERLEQALALLGGAQALALDIEDEDGRGEREKGRKGEATNLPLSPASPAPLLKNEDKK